MDEERNVTYNLEPPKDIEAEKAVLGSMMQDKDAVSDVIDKLKAEDFYLKEHQEIYKAFVDMYRKSINIDMQTAYSQLSTLKVADLVGGMAYLGKLTSDAIVPSNAKYYADSVLAKSRMRQLIHEADTIKTRAYAEEDDPEEILDFAEQRIYEIAQSSQSKNYVDINDILVENIKTIRELEKSEGALPGITTGFKDVDKLLGGLQKTDLVILAARPGMGKTSFALNLAANAAEAGHSVLIFSMEMSREQLGERMLSMEARVPLETIKRGTMSREDWMSVSAAQDDFDRYTISVDDASSPSILEIKNKCRRHKVEKGLDLVIIDYLQLMSLGYRVEQREKEISALTRAIKILAKELDCAVVLLSQLSRASEQRKEHRPQLSDLRDSGAIEQDADIVIFLRREDYYNDEDEAVDFSGGGTCEVTIAKHRNGPTGKVTLAWVGRYTKFDNLEWRGEGGQEE
jgi:replicative DNA helicase